MPFVVYGVVVALGIVGLFSLILGSVHFFFPKLLDFENAIPKDGPPIRPFPPGTHPLRHQAQ